MTDETYPEHEKLQAVVATSQAIGEFLDVGLPKLGFAIYEKFTRPCECTWCKIGRPGRSPWHTEDELATAVDGVVQISEWLPRRQSVQTILARYFGIDQRRLDAEKDAMLDAMRKANAR